MKTLESLVQHLILCNYIRSEKVINTMRKIDRKNFVPEDLQNYAYDDIPLEIGYGQTISAPHMVGIMVELLELESHNIALEIGSGSGYHAAIVADILKDGKVYTIERYEKLAEFARANLKKSNITNVEVIVGDGSLGLPNHNYDRIYVTCAAPEIPKPLIEQLKEDGIIVIPVGTKYNQEIIVARKKNNVLESKSYGGCVFVQMIGKYGFK